jgi:transcriptional regulator with XRE-family HTH domain
MPSSAEGANPTVRQRELGMRLREFRHARELTVEEVGERLLCSATKISRLETGARRASLRDVRDLCQIYGVTDQAEADGLMSLARQAREPDWWTQYDDLRLDPYISLEQEAVAITSFSMYDVTACCKRATTRGRLSRASPGRWTLRPSTNGWRSGSCASDCWKGKPRRATGRCWTKPSCTAKSVGPP